MAATLIGEEDAPLSATATLLDGEGEDPTPDELISRVSDPFYRPTPTEFKAFRKAKAERPASAERVVDAATAAAGQVAGDLYRGAKALATTDDPRDLLQSAGEGVARGGYDLGLMARKLGAENLWDGPLNEAQFIAAKAGQLNQEKYGKTGFTDAKQLYTAANLPDDVKEKFKKEYKDYTEGWDYEKFLAEQNLLRHRILATQGKENLVPAVVGKTNPQLAEGFSYVADPATLITAGAAAAPKAGLTGAEKIAGGVALKGGAVAEGAGNLATRVATVPERVAGKLTEAFTGDAVKADRVESAVGRGAIGAAFLSPLVVVPGFTEAGVAITAGKAAGAGLREAGEVAQAAGRGIAAGPSQYGLLERIAIDGAAPQWLRKAAFNARRMDGVIDAGSRLAEGAAAGAAVGGAIGLATDGDEGLGSGLGGGAILGGFSTLAGGMAGRAQRRAFQEDGDLAHWLARKTPAEIENIQGMKLRRDEALKMADVERLARGVVGPENTGDVEFHYVRDSEFQKLFGNVGKGAQVIAGDRPAVYVNTDYKGGRSLFHETFHALEQLDMKAPRRGWSGDTEQLDMGMEAHKRLNSALFDQVLPDGQVVSQGLYSPQEVDAFANQYVRRLSPLARQEFELMPAEERRGRIQSELRAESFSNLVSGSETPLLARDANSLRRRVVDSLLRSDAGETLGRMRGVLERAGITFERSGDPSELFARHGRGVTNSPEVDAALRDYIRAKASLTRRVLMGAQETPALALTAEQLSRPGSQRIALAYKDADIFAKNPDGSLLLVGSGDKPKPVKLPPGPLKLRGSPAAAPPASEQAPKPLIQITRGAQGLEARAGDGLVKPIAARPPTGSPVLLSEPEIKKIQAKRVGAMIAALDRVPSDGQPGALAKNENGSYAGKFMSDAQIEALMKLPDDIFAPSLKEKMRRLNDLMKGGEGNQVLFDYNAALKKGKYSSGISSVIRSAVPFTMKISKAGNFFVETLDTSHFFRKLNDWRQSKPKAFEPWSGDVDRFMGDVFQYLRNHSNGLPGATDLDRDPAQAVLKRNLINDFFNVPKGEGVNPINNNAKGDKDNLIRSRRFDRINRITPGTGAPFPFRYDLQKVNFLPAPEPGMTIREVGRDFPIDNVRPRFLDVAQNSQNIVRAAAVEFLKMPTTVVAGDGSPILIRNPEQAYLADRVRHLVWDHAQSRLNPAKAQWLPMVPETLQNAAVRLVDEQTGNRIYVRAYQGGMKHMVVVRPDGMVVAQKPFTGRLITQFPDSNLGGRRGGMRIEWVRNGRGQTQGNPAPTPAGSTLPEARHPEFRREPTPPGLSTQEVNRQAMSQAVIGLRSRLAKAAGLSESAIVPIVDTLKGEIERAVADPRQAAQLIERVGDQEVAALVAVLRSKGLSGASHLAKQIAKLRTLR